MQIPDPPDLARASFKPPRNAQGVESRRIPVFLRSTDDGRFRWFREDGTRTVVDGPTIERASRAAHIVWDTWGLKIDEES